MSHDAADLWSGGAAAVAELGTVADRAARGVQRRPRHIRRGGLDAVRLADVELFAVLRGDLLDRCRVAVLSVAGQLRIGVCDMRGVGSLEHEYDGASCVWWRAMLLVCVCVSRAELSQTR